MSQEMLVIAICGKRFVGKDTFVDFLVPQLEAEGFKVERRSLASVFKASFARDKHLDYERLLSDRNYKEQHRSKMISAFDHWYAARPSFCCEEVLGGLTNLADILIITDVRLRADLEFLAQNTNLIKIKLAAPDAVRIKFGWKFDDKIDHHWTETDLESLPNSDFICIENPGDKIGFEKLACDFVHAIKQVRHNLL